MSRAIDTTGNLDDLPCIFEAQRGDIRVEVLEYRKSCGHPGHLIEFYLRNESDDDEMQMGCFGREDLQVTIELMQHASQVIAARTGVRPLQTVRLGNKTFFVDENLKELRNIDDPKEKMELR